MRRVGDWLDMGNSGIRTIQECILGWFQAPWLARGKENVNEQVYIREGK